MTTALAARERAGALSPAAAACARGQDGRLSEDVRWGLLPRLVRSPAGKAKPGGEGTVPSPPAPAPRGQHQGPVCAGRVLLAYGIGGKGWGAETEGHKAEAPLGLRVLALVPSIVPRPRIQEGEGGYCPGAGSWGTLPRAGAPTETLDLQGP